MSQTVPLSEAIVLQRGFDLPTSQRRSGRYPVVTSTGMATTHNEFKVKGPGVVIGRSGSIGGGQYVTDDFWPLNTTLWVKDFKGNNEKFIYYLLKSLDFSSFNAGAAVPTLNRNHLSALKVHIPGRDEQDKIADILGTIDEKIELNRQMNETLEQMGQALFRHYFIDNPEVEKWEVGNISKLAENVRDNVKPPFSDTLRYVALEHFTPHTLALYDSTSADKATSNKTKFKKYDILFGKLRPYFHKVAVVPFDGICSTDILAVRPKKEEYFAYTSFFMSQKSLIEYTTQASEGTRMPRTSWTNICNYPVALPPNDLLQKFNEEAGSLIKSLIDNAQQAQTLTALRDALLPRLMSGKVKI